MSVHWRGRLGHGPSIKYNNALEVTRYALVKPQAKVNFALLTTNVPWVSAVSDPRGDTWERKLADAPGSALSTNPPTQIDYRL